MVSQIQVNFIIKGNYTVAHFSLPPPSRPYGLPGPKHKPRKLLSIIHWDLIIE